MKDVHVMYILLSREEENFETSRKNKNDHRRVHTRGRWHGQIDKISEDFQRSHYPAKVFIAFSHVSKVVKS